MTDFVARSSSSSPSSALSYALSPSMRLARRTLRIRRSATGQSCASPPVNRMAIRRPLTSASAWIFVLRPPRERPTACFCSPLLRRRLSGSFHVRGVDHLHIRGSSLAGKLSEQVFPNAAPYPANKSVIDRRRRAIFGWDQDCLAAAAKLMSFDPSKQSAPDRDEERAAGRPGRVPYDDSSALILRAGDCRVDISNEIFTLLRAAYIV